MKLSLTTSVRYTVLFIIIISWDKRLRKKNTKYDSGIGHVEIIKDNIKITTYAKF